MRKAFRVSIAIAIIALVATFLGSQIRRHRYRNECIRNEQHRVSMEIRMLKESGATEDSYSISRRRESLVFLEDSNHLKRPFLETVEIEYVPGSVIAPQSQLECSIYWISPRFTGGSLRIWHRPDEQHPLEIPQVPPRTFWDAERRAAHAKMFNRFCFLPVSLGKDYGYQESEDDYPLPTLVVPSAILTDKLEVSLSESGGKQSNRIELHLTEGARKHIRDQIAPAVGAS